MSQQLEDVFEKLRKFVESEIPAPRPPSLSRQTELLSNLKMAEEDAEDFLSKWFELNNIDVGDFQFSRYFPSEGLWLLPRLKKSSKSVPISLGMLELATKMQRWDSKVLEHAYLHNNYEEPTI
jgi:hypothetical protein